MPEPAGPQISPAYSAKVFLYSGKRMKSSLTKSAPGMRRKEVFDLANEKSVKVYVPVDVRFDESGRMLPRAVIWEDGTKYEIDEITDIRPAPAQKAGGQGDRYTVMIRGTQCCLFFERAATVTGCNLGRWFVKRKKDSKRDYMIKASLKLDDALKKANPVAGVIQFMDCPICGGKQTINYTRTKYNGHISGDCSSCHVIFRQ